MVELLKLPETLHTGSHMVFGKCPILFVYSFELKDKNNDAKNVKMSSNEFKGQIMKGAINKKKHYKGNILGTITQSMHY